MPNITESPSEYPRRILVAVTGLSPQIVTETLYALAVAPSGAAFVPTEIHLITTRSGAEKARLALLSEEPGWFNRLCQDYALPPIRFAAETIHVLEDANGQPLEDIRSPDDNRCAADGITGIIRRFTADPDCALHVSIAGGRKTMGFFLAYTLLHAEAVLTLYGAGLDPFVGFYHALDFGRESLACDLVEPLRVEVDQHALMLFRSEKLRADDFSRTDSGCLLGKAGRARFYAEWEPVAARLRKLLAESVSDVAAAIGQAGGVDAPCSEPTATDPAADDDGADGGSAVAESDDDDFGD